MLKTSYLRTFFILTRTARK